jgi:hypothetical protein
LKAILLIIAVHIGLAAVVFGSISSSKSPAKWERATYEGFIKGPNELELFGTGRKEMALVVHVAGWGYWRRLAFASEADYREAEKHIGQAVVMRVIEVKYGEDAWFLVESVAVKE